MPRFKCPEHEGFVDLARAVCAAEDDAAANGRKDRKQEAEKVKEDLFYIIGQIQDKVETDEYPMLLRIMRSRVLRIVLNPTKDHFETRLES